MNYKRVVLRALFWSAGIAILRHFFDGPERTTVAGLVVLVCFMGGVSLLLECHTRYQQGKGDREQDR